MAGTVSTLTLKVTTKALAVAIFGKATPAALVGFAAGLVYNAVLSTVTRWFQDKQGIISGLLLMGFGIGGFGDIMRAINNENLTEYQNPETKFIMEGLKQHTNIYNIIKYTRGQGYEYLY